MSGQVDSAPRTDQAKRGGSVLGAGIIVTGDVYFFGNLHIDGAVHGNVCSRKDHSGTLVVGAAGHVEGTVDVARLIVSGQITGRIIADEYLTLNANARVHGDIAYTSAEIQLGAVVHGQLSKSPALPPAPELASATSP